MRHLVLVLFAVLLAPAAFGAQVFRFPLVYEPVSLDWSNKRAFYEITVLFNIMEGLVETDESFNPVPALAERWTVSADKLTYVFYLKPHVKWSDGAPLKAKDFLYSWNRLKSPATKSEYSTYLSEIKEAKALDDQTIELKLERPNPLFIQKFRHYATFPQRTDLKITLGPYRLTEWQKGKSLVFERNPTYHGTPPRLERVVAIIEKDSKKIREMAAKNEIDLFFNANTSDVVNFTTKADSQWHLRQYDALNVTFLAFKPAKGPAAQKNFRRAVALAIDPSKIPTLQNSGKAQAVSLIPKNMLGFEPAALATDVAKARAVLPGKFPVKLAVRKDLHETLGKHLASQLKAALGIDVQVATVSTSGFLDEVERGAFDMYIEQWWPDDPDPISFIRRMTSNNLFNRTGWKNARYDKLVQEAQASTNALTSSKLLGDAQKLLLQEEVVIVPLYHLKTTALAHNKVVDFRLSPLLNDLYFKNIGMRP